MVVPSDWVTKIFPTGIERNKNLMVDQHYLHNLVSVIQPPPQFPNKGDGTSRTQEEERLPGWTLPRLAAWHFTEYPK